MPHHLYHHRPGFRYRRRFYRRHWPYRWSWLHSPDSPEGPVPSPFVAWAQRVLAQVFGPIVPQDGVLGPETRRFVGQFQAQNGLPTTGDLDGATVSALQAAAAGSLAAPIPRDSGALHPGGREPPRLHPRESAMARPGHSAPQSSPAPISSVAPAPSEAPPRPRHGHPPGPPESGEQKELAPGFTEALKRGQWVRDGGRVVLIGV
jgi:hypothetical protein